MRVVRNLSLIIVGVMLVLLPAVVLAAPHATPTREGTALPASAWWLVIHDQCNDTLHWINPSGEFATIPRPVLPGEAAGSPCSYRPLHISQDGRYLVQTAPLASGRQGIGFYDLQTGAWLATHQTEADEFVYLGERYSSSSDNRIAIGLANAETAPRAWRVILFDMTTGNPVEELRSEGPEIASFVGGEFLATAPVIPSVVLVATDDITGAEQIHIRFDGFEGADPIGAIAWYPAGVPGVGQKLVSSIYAEQDIDVQPDGHAIFAYTDPAYPDGPPPPVGEVGVDPPDTNAIGLLLPDAVGDNPAPQLYFADGVSTLYNPQWAADGAIALFRRTAGDPTVIYWIRIGTSVLVPLERQAAQILGVPAGFVFNTADGIFFLDEATGLESGPVFSDPSLSGSAAFVWATAFGDPLLALDTIATPAEPVEPLPGFVTATPVSPSACRVASADGSTINIRGNPMTDGLVVGQLSGAEELPVVGYTGDWYAVSYGGGGVGWVAGWVTELRGDCAGLTYIDLPSSPAPTEPPPSATGPDLYVSEFALDPATPTKGQAVNVRVGVYNQGNAAATGSFHIEWYPGENYPSPACAWDLDGLVAIGGRILTCTYAGYPSPYASINTMVKVDTANTIVETNESNNIHLQPISVSDVAAPPAGQPDLFVSEFSLDPATPTKGEPVNVRVGVYNQGTVAVSTTFHIEWYPGENYPSPACSWDLDSMAAGGGRILTCTYAGYPSPYGSINTLVRVDTANTVAESNESNNSYAQAISVSDSAPPPAGQPDLYVSEFSLSPSTPIKGQPVDVRIGVYNQGTASTSASFHVEWYPGENYPSPACSWTVNGMVAHGGKILTCTYAGYPSPYGSINTMIRVDTGNAVSESDEANNTYKQNISVNNP